MHRGGAQDALLVERFQRRRDIRTVSHLLENLGELVTVLERQARALPDVGHRRVARVAEERHVSIRPRFSHTRISIPQISCFDRRRVRGTDELQHLGRPPRQGFLKELRGVLLVGRVRGRGFNEPVPLHAPRTVGARHEVMVRTDERAVPDVLEVIRLEQRQTRVQLVAGEARGGSGAFHAAGFAEHLRANLGPDTVRADQHVRGDDSAILQSHVDTLPVISVLVLGNRRSHADDPGGVLIDFLQQHLLQVAPVDADGEWEVSLVRELGDGAEREHPVALQTVADTRGGAPERAAHVRHSAE